MDIYQINGSTYDFTSKLPKVNGELLRTNKSIADSMVCLIKSIGYQFNSITPVPTFLKNAVYVDRKFLVNVFNIICEQITNIPVDVLLISTLSLEGFSISLNDSDIPKRLCTVHLKGDGFSKVKYVPINKVSECVSMFFSSQLPLQKVVEIR